MRDMLGAEVEVGDDNGFAGIGRIVILGKENPDPYPPPPPLPKPGDGPKLP